MKYLYILLAILTLSSCRGCFSDYQGRANGVHKVCPHCTFVTSEQCYYACDTSKQPNIVYKVYFRAGGIYYDANTVDHLVRIN